MPDYKINGGRILIVPGKTDEEILQESAKKNAKKITEPPALYFSVQNVQYTPHLASYEEFPSAQGGIQIEKACDRSAEIELDILVHQQLSNQKGNILINKQTREARLRVEDNEIEEGDRDDGIYVNRWVRPEEFTDEYIELRGNFFGDLDKRPLTIVSSLFPPMPVGYMTECNFNIGEGEEDASYSVTFKESLDTIT